MMESTGESNLLAFQDLRWSNFFSTIFCMPENDLKIRIRKLAVELAEIAELMPEDEVRPNFPESAEQLLEKRICLACGKAIPAKKREIRGLHESCYKKTKDAIRQFKTTENQLIEAGLLAPVRVTGRPVSNPTPLDEFLLAAESQAEYGAGIALGDKAIEIAKADTAARKKKQKAETPETNKKN